MQHNQFISDRGQIEKTETVDYWKKPITEYRLKLSGNNTELEDKANYVVLFLRNEHAISDTHKLRVINAMFTEMGDILSRITFDKPEYNSTVNSDGIDLEIAYFLKLFGGFMQSFHNSHSWRNQDLQEFDVHNFKDKLFNLIDQL